MASFRAFRLSWPSGDRGSEEVGLWDSNPRSGSKVVGVAGSGVLEVAVSLAGSSCCFGGSASAVGSACSGGSGAGKELIMGSWAAGVKVPVSFAGLSC